MEIPDLYAILGVAPTASRAEINRAYRGQLRRHHPDTRTPTDPSQAQSSDGALQRVLAAYAVIGDPARRADYDRRREPQRHRALAVPRRTILATGIVGQPAAIIAGPVRWHARPEPRDGR